LHIISRGCWGGFVRLLENYCLADLSVPGPLSQASDRLHLQGNLHRTLKTEVTNFSYSGFVRRATRIKVSCKGLKDTRNWILKVKKCIWRYSLPILDIWGRMLQWVTKPTRLLFTLFCLAETPSGLCDTVFT
jgi:hypothetical protein